MQLKKRNRRKANGLEIRTQVVALAKFNPVAPAGFELAWATLHHSGKAVVVTTQPRGVTS